MNVFDVLREKLKEKSELYRREEEIQKSNPCYQIGVYGFKATGYEDAIEIVNQVEQEFTPKTNADRIRSMSDEELAKFLSCTEKNLEIRIGLTRGILDWLKQEVVDD